MFSTLDFSPNAEVDFGRDFNQGNHMAEIAGVPAKLEIKAADLNQAKISEVNKILEKILAEKNKGVHPNGVFDLHISL